MMLQAKVFTSLAERPLELQNEIHLWLHWKVVAKEDIAVALTSTADGKLIALLLCEVLPRG